MVTWCLGRASTMSGLLYMTVIYSANRNSVHPELTPQDVNMWIADCPVGLTALNN